VILVLGWGRIVNMSSILGQVAMPVAPAYIAAKHGLIGLTKVTITCQSILRLLTVAWLVMPYDVTRTVIKLISIKYLCSLRLRWLSYWLLIVAMPTCNSAAIYLLYVFCTNIILLRLLRRAVVLCAVAYSPLGHLGHVPPLVFDNCYLNLNYLLLVDQLFNQFEYLHYCIICIG